MTPKVAYVHVAIWLVEGRPFCFTFTFTFKSHYFGRGVC
jgi:hypothetical protein